MSLPYSKDNWLKPSALTCEQWPDSPTVRFSALVTADGGVLVQVGDHSAIIRREELAAAATLFPVRSKSKL